MHWLWSLRGVFGSTNGWCYCTLTHSQHSFAFLGLSLMLICVVQQAKLSFQSESVDARWWHAWCQAGKKGSGPSFQLWRPNATITDVLDIDKHGAGQRVVLLCYQVVVASVLRHQPRCWHKTQPGLPMLDHAVGHTPRCTEHTQMHRTYPDAQNIPRCTEHTQMHRTYPDAQNIPRCTEHTQMHRTYPDAQNTPWYTHHTEMDRTHGMTSVLRHQPRCWHKTQPGLPMLDHAVGHTPRCTEHT